ncbi:hypothetical protein J6P92_08000 [bacterium]|nr:hypothetical protein [bacterium]
MNKKRLKDLIKNKDTEKLKDELRNAYYNPKINIENWEDKKLLPNEKGFKFAGYTRRTKYYYFVSNIGRFLIVKWNSKKELDINNVYKTEIFEENKCWVIYQNPDTLCLDIARLKNTHKEHEGYVYNSSTPLYNFVGETWLQDEYVKAKSIAIDENDRIELHHIDGNNLNCSCDNLIYIPNSIHACVHIKNN